MQLSSQDRSRFFRRMQSSLGVFALLVSVALNVFLLLDTGDTVIPSYQSATPTDESLRLGPQAFGAISRGFSLRPQKTSGASPLTPVTAYSMKEGLLPAMKDTLLLYRDQGVGIDEKQVEAMFHALGVSIDWRQLQLLPLSEKWRAADRTMELTLDIPRRALTVSRVGSFPASTDGSADDLTAIAIAKEFAESLGINVGSVAPIIVERAAEGTTPSRTYVAWPMMFAGVPLLDTDGKPVPLVQVQIGRLSRKALSATLTLLQPEHLAQSGYPLAPTQKLIQGFASGGLLPVAKDAKGKAQAITYDAAEQVYVLLPADSEYPLYIVPAVAGYFHQGATRVTTFVPAIDPVQFQWIQK